MLYSCYTGVSRYIYIYIYREISILVKNRPFLYIYRVIYIPGHFNFSERTYHIIFLKPYSNNDFGAFIGFARRRRKFSRFLLTKIQFSIENLLKTTQIFTLVGQSLDKISPKFHDLYIYRVIYIPGNFDFSARIPQSIYIPGYIYTGKPLYDLHSKLFKSTMCILYYEKY